jgi:hypothetical protein
LTLLYLLAAAAAAAVESRQLDDETVKHQVALRDEDMLAAAAYAQWNLD